MDVLERLLEHDRWANAEVLRRCRELGDGQLDQAFDIGHRTIRATFDHYLPNIAFWAGLMRQALDTGEPVVGSLGDLIGASERAHAAGPPGAVDSWLALHERAYDQFAAVARQVQAEGRLEESFLIDSGYPFTYGGAILMVILHHEGHRIEIIHILARSGVPSLAQVELDHGLWDFCRRGLG
ncbi:MAG TPA: DinB family protein [Thermomicrobiales bacterium]|nr:DinB family protein [Thermomicrobiales bacterium]